MSITLSKITKYFQNTLIIDHISLEISDGQFFVLLGGSGSGKSTLLRLIAGLESPDSGIISLGGSDVTRLPPQKRNTGFVFQNYSIFPHMNVLENVEFGLRIRKIPVEERRRRSMELLELVGLSGLELRYPDQLSGGQRQRVALARALVVQPSVLLLDEPFGALDVKIRQQLRESVKEIQRQLGVTTILVTHDQEEAFELSDSLGLIERGHLIEVGTPEDLYLRPKKQFTAVFIGGGNVVVGRKQDNNIKLGSTTIPFPASAPAHDEGAPVAVMFRPEWTVVSKESETPEGLVPLGKTRIVGRSFRGSVERLRVVAPGLQGARVLAPQMPYEQTLPMLDVAVPGPNGSAPAEGTSHLWLKNYHIMQPSGLRSLILVPSQVDSPARKLGVLIAQRSRAGTTFLVLGAARGKEAEIQAQLENFKTSVFEEFKLRVDTEVRTGDMEAQALRAIQEGWFDLVVIDRPGILKPARDPHWTLARRILEAAKIPVLMAREPRSQLKKFLICTAAGEPAKAAVRLGGRLARMSAAEVSLLHVSPHTPRPIEKVRVQIHFQKAESFLASLGVKAKTETLSGPVLEKIVDYARAYEPDLLILGASDPHRLDHSNRVAIEIMNRLTVPVLVVPGAMV